MAAIWSCELRVWRKAEFAPLESMLRWDGFFAEDEVEGEAMVVIESVPGPGPLLG